MGGEGGYSCPAPLVPPGLVIKCTNSPKRRLPGVNFDKQHGLKTATQKPRKISKRKHTRLKIKYRQLHAKKCQRQRIFSFPLVSSTTWTRSIVFKCCVKTLFFFFLKLNIKIYVSYWNDRITQTNCSLVFCKIFLRLSISCGFVKIPHSVGTDVLYLVLILLNFVYYFAFSVH